MKHFKFLALFQLGGAGVAHSANQHSSTKASVISRVFARFGPVSRLSDKLFMKNEKLTTICL